MSNRYAPLPNPRTDEDAENEMEAAFDDSDDDDEVPTSATHPLNNPTTSQYSQLPTQPPAPGTYDFENVDYDYPPPGSPPLPSTTALPNDYGNSNGLVPTFERRETNASAHSRGWFRKTADAILPSHFRQKLGLAPRIPKGAIGGGIVNDGVFSNVSAKPSRSVRVGEGDNAYMVPEDVQNEAPPSYASAQADAVPPYWENTVHAPFSSDSPGDMIIENLPTGTLFSFLWNMLVTISFQFVGFLLTYLLHTTHAARLGSRSGLGVILIQYGFALRNAVDKESNPDMDQWSWSSSPEAAEYYNNSLNATMGTPTTNDEVTPLVVDATKQWLSFFLMTVGWFILLTSLLNFWRVKRWERGILATQRENVTAVPASRSASSNLERVFGIRNALILRQGLEFNIRWEPTQDRERPEDADSADGHTEVDTMIPIDPNDPERSERMRVALAHEMRLRADLQAAGLI